MRSDDTDECDGLLIQDTGQEAHLEQRNRGGTLVATLTSCSAPDRGTRPAGANPLPRHTARCFVVQNESEELGIAQLLA